jgi:histidinol-phosphate aminotransferase
MNIRPNVLKMHPYSPGKPISEVKRELGLDRVIKLASNENPYGPSPKALEAVSKAAAEMHVYPDGAAFELRQALSVKFEIDPSGILLGNGSDELIHLLGLILLDSPEDEVVVGDPSFVRYDAAAHLAPCRLVKVPLDADLRHDLPAMARATTDRTKLLFIANPNNPTGTLVRRSEVDALLADLPPTTVVVLDEAYFEFAAHESDYPNSADYVRAGQPVVGLRTFSKAYGLAGIRLGYGFAPGAIVDAVDRAREPFDVNSLAQAAGIAALQDDEYVRQTVTRNRRGLERIAEAFRQAGARPYESYANFVFADLGRPARPVFQALLQRGIIVRSGEVLGMPHALRVSVGTEDEVEAFCEAFAEVAATVPA